jgi:predicted amidohydrolase
LGLSICYDIRFPELFREQAIEGATVFANPAAFLKTTGEAHWHIL